MPLSCAAIPNTEPGLLQDRFARFCEVIKLPA